MFRPDHPCLPPLEPPMYVNRAMSRDEAVNILTDIGVLVSDRTADGRPVAHTARIEFEPAGKGYNAVVPVELLARLYDRGFVAGMGG